MLQEDSNGEASFEIIEKKNSELSIIGDKTESLSSVSSAYSIPSPSLITSPGGNLLSNIAPPSTLPDFTLWPTQTVTGTTATTAAAPTSTTHYSTPVNVQPISSPFPATVFSAAIPPSKAFQQTPSPNIAQESDLSNVGGSIFGWMKEAVSTGGILHKVAEKAKNSVDSIITTLDPQMTDFIYSGGDLEVTVVSQTEEDISIIREAFYTVFGKTQINGINTSVPQKTTQPIGFENAIKEATDKIEASLQLRKTPTVVIENFLLQQNNKFYDLSVIILKDTEKEISLQTFTQTTPIPSEAFLRKAEKELPDYTKYSASKDLTLSAYLRVCKPGWQELLTGVTRREVLLLAARSLIQLYKNHIDVNQSST